MKEDIVFQGKDASLKELAIFTALARGPQSATALAPRLSLEPARAQALLDGLVTSGLIELRAGLYSNVRDVDDLIERSSHRLEGHRRAALSTVLAVAALVVAALVLWQRTERPFQSTAVRAAPSLPARAQQTAPNSALVSKDDTFTYYLVGSQEQADLAVAVLQAVTRSGSAPPATAPDHVIVLIDSPEKETQVRRTIDDANRQMAAYGEPGFRIVDLRPALASLAP